MSMHESFEKKAHHKINDYDTDDRSHIDSPDSGKKKKILMLVLIGCLFIAAVIALILVLVLKSNDGSTDVPGGYNGYTVVSAKNGMWYYEANVTLSKSYTPPVVVDNVTNPQYKDLFMRASMMNDKTFRIKINPKPLAPTENADEFADRWEIPDSIFAGSSKDDYGMRLTWGKFDNNSDTVGFDLASNYDNRLFVSTKKRNLVFTEYYIEMGFLVDSQKIYGFGERQREFELAPGEYSSWANGRDNNYDPGELGHNSYGDHPFVLWRLVDGTFVGIFFRNSNAKALNYVRVKNYQSILNFKAIGGILDFYVFADESAEEVIKAYHGVIGKPFLPPFWALGFHQSSWQYNDTKRIDEVLSGYDTSDMPLEGIWLDIEYMDGYRNFEVNTTRFEDLIKLSTALKDKKQKLITIVDAGFQLNSTYPYYRSADENNLFIKSNKNPTLHNGNLIGKVWPGKSAFLDFWNPKTTNFWVNALKGLYTLTNTDGIWIDMNECTTFCDGECPGDEQMGADANSTYPYSPTGKNYTIQNFSLSMDGQHFSLDEKSKLLNTEFNMHSLYGHLQAKATYQFWMDETAVNGRRPFVLSRSTFAGSGSYTAHWLGDNWSKWEYMRYSISGILSFNLYGIPLVGADVCGFHGKFDPEMCARWMQLSTFYPFARNHYNLTDLGKEFLPPQEPYNLEGKFKVAAKNAINQRYGWLRYFYTRLFEIHKYGGGTLVRPLFFEFPDDEQAGGNYEDTFMVGSALKVTPVLTPEAENKGNVQSYFPAKSRFISLSDLKTIVETGEKGQNVTLAASWDYTNVHLKEGSIVPWQNVSESQSSILRTFNLAKDIGLNLIVFPDKNGNAEGTVFIETDGDDMSAFNVNHFEYYKLRYDNKTLRISLMDGHGSEGKLESPNHLIRNVFILGVGKLNATDLAACSYSSNLQGSDILADYSEEGQYVRLTVNQATPMYIHQVLALQFTAGKSDTAFCKSTYKVDSVTSNNKSKIEMVITSDFNLPSMKVTFILVKNNLVRVLVEDPSKQAFKVTDDVFNPEMLPLDGHLSLEDIESVLTVPKAGETFFFEIHEPNTQKVIYSTKGQQLVFSPNYIKMTSVINSNGRIFGLGERVGDFFLKEGVYTMWNRDEPSPTENGARPGNNIYGTHPVYFSQMKSSNQFFAVFDNNAGAQDVIIERDPNGMKLTHIKTSGVTDLLIILNGDIKAVVGEFINLVGHPVMVPEWSLGWHQCRYGYNTSEQVKDVVENYLSHDIPLDVIWTDIDYMDMYKDFTLSKEYFGDLPAYVAKWKTDHAIRYVPILDAAVAYEEGSKDTAYSRGVEQKVFIADPNNPKAPFVGKVWPGPAVFIDWLADNAQKYWVDELTKLFQIIQFDGVWIDMNEAANFCNGHCYNEQKVASSIQNNLFYIPGSRDLNTKSISIDAKHKDGSTELEAHSLYGFYMSKATSAYFSQTKARPFVITRSTYSGVGKFVSHWLGDNFSQFDMLKHSIGGIYLFNMFGVPVTGADICGFILDTYPELCARWYALGAFYPFARNHNDKNSVPQEPYVDMFQAKMPGTNATYTAFMREMSLKRYALHRYHYSSIHRASTDGSVYFRPLFYSYPDDSNAFSNVEQNIMLGDSVKVSPIVSSVSSQQFYFPEKGATWCPIWPKYQLGWFPGQSFQSIPVPLDEVLVHIKSGSIVPLQLGDLTSVPLNVNIERLKAAPTDLAILTDSNYLASGFMRFDDGLTTDLSKYSEFAFIAKGTSPFFGSAYLDLTFQLDKDDSDDKTSENQNLGSIIIYNASQYKFSNSSIATVTYKDKTKAELEPVCNAKQNIWRFVGKDGTKLPIRNIATVHIGAK